MHPELQEAHHFLFDLPFSSSPDRCDFLVIGLNPGESSEDWRNCPHRTEETSQYDFHEEYGASTGSKRWKSEVERYCGSLSGRETQFFFWSSKDTGKAFKNVFGTEFDRSPHLEFCRDLNEELIKRLQPKFIVAPGVSKSGLFARLYGLSPSGEIRHVVGRDRNGNERQERLVAHFERDGLPWIFTKHWTAGHGLRDEDRLEIANYISANA